MAKMTSVAPLTPASPPLQAAGLQAVGLQAKRGRPPYGHAAPPVGWETHQHQRQHQRQHHHHQQQQQQQQHHHHHQLPATKAYEGQKTTRTGACHSELTIRRVSE